MRFGLVPRILLAGGIVVALLAVEFVLVLRSLQQVRHLTRAEQRAEQSIVAASPPPRAGRAGRGAVVRGGGPPGEADPRRGVGAAGVRDPARPPLPPAVAPGAGRPAGRDGGSPRPGALRVREHARAGMAVVR